MKRLDSKIAWLGCLLAIFLFGSADMMAQPANDNICDAIVITVDDAAVSMDNTGATIDGPDGSCWFGSDAAQVDIWASFVVPSTGTVTIQTFDTEGNDDTQLGLYSSSDGTCTGTLTEVGCNDDDAIAGSLMSELYATGLTVGETMWIQIDGYASTVGTFDISVVSVDAPPPPPANDNCDGATVTPLTGDGTVVSISGDGTGATDGLGAGAAQVFEAFSIDFCATVVMSYCDSENPPAAYFTQATDCPATIGYAVEPDTCANGEWIVTWPLLEPGTYYYPLVADLGFMDALQYTVTFSATEIACLPPPANDNLCDATELVVNGPTVTMDNSGGTTDGPVGSCFSEDPGTIEGDIWATFVAPASGSVTIETIVGVNNDTQVAVYSSADGTCAGELTEVGCNDDISTTDFMSFVELTDLTAGDTYFVQIDGWGGAAGDFGIVVLDPTIDLCPAPDAVICDNFDDYTLGAIDVQAAHWGPWGVGGTVSNVSDYRSFSNDKSLYIGPGGVEDNLLLLGDQTTGQWTIDWMAYVPADSTGFFNLQGDPTPGTANIFQAFYNQGDSLPGIGNFTARAETFAYPADQWFPVSISVDLDAATYSLTVNDVAVLTDVDYVSGVGSDPTALSAINFYSIDAANAHYVDDVVFDGDAGFVPCPAPTAVICDNADDYTLGPVNGQGAHWDTWSGTLGGAEDAIVTDEQSFSNGQSFLIQEGQAQDALLRLGDQATGQWTLDWKMYIPVGKNGYYNFQGANNPGDAFIAEVYFNETNGTPGEGTWADTAFTYPEGEWFDVMHAIDLDTDEIMVTIAGNVVGTFPYTVAGGDLLSSVDFFSADVDNNRYYIDDVIYDGDPGDVLIPCPAPTAVICDNADEYTLGPVNGQGAHWDTWSGTLGGAEDAIVSDEQAFSNGQSFLIQEGQAQDALLRLGDQSMGLWTLDWKMYIPSGKNGYYNFQGANVPGDAFIAEVYFNETNGTPGEGTWAGTAFTYTEDAWFDVAHVIDLNNDVITVTIDGNLVGEFPYTVAGGDLLSSIDFFSADVDNNRYYLDDIIFDGDPNNGVIEYTESAFTVYPNPTDDMLTISGDKQIDAVVLRDVLGAIVRQMDTPLSNNVTIDVAGLTNGVYFVEVRVGDVVNVSRVIKN